MLASFSSFSKSAALFYVMREKNNIVCEPKVVERFSVDHDASPFPIELSKHVFESGGEQLRRNSITLTYASVDGDLDVVVEQSD